MRGRKPTPTLLKAIAGNPGGRALRTDEPMPSGELDAPPADLTPSQQRIWREAIENSPPGLLKQLDASLLRIWVVAFDIHREASEHVARHGLIIKSPSKGVPMQNPYLPIINRQAGIMMKAAAEMGFSPSSRGRVGSTTKTTKGNRFANNGKRPTT